MYLVYTSIYVLSMVYFCPFLYIVCLLQTGGAILEYVSLDLLAVNNGSHAYSGQDGLYDLLFLLVCDKINVITLFFTRYMMSGL